MIYLRGQQLIQHVHSGRKQHALIGLTRFPAEHFGQKRLADPRIPDQNQIRALAQERQIEQPQDAVLGLHATLMVMKVERVDAGLRLQARGLKAAFNRAALLRFQLDVGQPFERGGQA